MFKMFNFSSSIFSMILILTLILLIYSILLQNNNPIILLLIQIFYTLLISLMISFKNISLFSIILFISMVGGMMIMFLFFTASIGNEYLNLSMKMMNFFFLSILTIFIIMIFTMNHNNSYFNINDSISIKFIYHYCNSLLFTLSIFYLLLTLFFSIKICKQKYSLMRKF